MSPIIIAITSAIGLLILFALFDKFFIPWQAERTVKKLIKDKKSSNPRILENPKYGTLLPNDNSLEIINRKGDKFTFQWDEIEKIHAFKRDLVTTDLVCVAFELSGGKFVEIHEEMVGWHDLQTWFIKLFPDIRADWFMTVVFPAFQANHTIIWKRN